MKPLLLKVTENAQFSFHIRHERAPFFDNPWHYHPEVELTLVLQSTGLRFVGDSIERFDAGDLVLLGPNLPHYWHNDARYYNSVSMESAEAIILRFRSDLWGRDFLKAPELAALNSLFNQATFGIHFSPDVAYEVQRMLTSLLVATGLERMSLWLRIFGLLASTPNRRRLSQKAFNGTKPAEDSERINHVLAYIQEHMKQDIRLADIAATANMNPAAFCRYFRQQTNKTFVELLTELRINYACRLLIETQRDVAEICFESGFRNVPHFNYLFKIHKGTSPTLFRQLRH
ncbi:AraC family transcriptional regulator [Spirosoma daeguense]